MNEHAVAWRLLTGIRSSGRVSPPPIHSIPNLLMEDIRGWYQRTTAPAPNAVAAADGRVCNIKLSISRPLHDEFFMQRLALCLISELRAWRGFKRHSNSVAGFIPSVDHAADVRLSNVGCGSSSPQRSTLKPAKFSFSSVDSSLPIFPDTGWSLLNQENIIYCLSNAGTNSFHPKGHC